MPNAETLTELQKVEKQLAKLDEQAMRIAKKKADLTKKQKVLKDPMQGLSHKQDARRKIVFGVAALKMIAADPKLKEAFIPYLKDVAKSPTDQWLVGLISEKPIRHQKKVYAYRVINDTPFKWNNRVPDDRRKFFKDNCTRIVIGNEYVFNGEKKQELWIPNGESLTKQLYDYCIKFTKESNFEKI